MIVGYWIVPRHRIKVCCGLWYGSLSGSIPDSDCGLHSTGKKLNFSVLYSITPNAVENN